MANIDKLLSGAKSMGASDLHLVSDSMPYVRVNGDLKTVKIDKPMSSELIQRLLFEILTPDQKKNLEAIKDLDFSYEVEGLGRFRGNALWQKKGMDAVFRCIPTEIPTLEELGFPPVVKKLTDHHQGLILVTGPTRSGKSTTLAALVNEINEKKHEHILTIEDPIEYIHPNKKSVVNQREVGKHTDTFASALRASLREDPDIIMVGELRDIETMSMAITASETGHLVLATLQTSGAHKTIDRVLDSFPPSQQSQIRTMVSESLKGVISQQLIKRADGKGMVAALEILIGTVPLANLIREGKTFQIPSLMQTGRNVGMVKMDDALKDLVQQGTITAEEAYRYANDKRTFEQLLPKEGGVNG
ncbi:MAG: type IV pilus twitching motility protein PilT [Proteobacteria bacterium]|nr:type IV pilus twitching motility protein PilT [Pseudomonadota bacterium]